MTYHSTRHSGGFCHASGATDQEGTDGMMSIDEPSYHDATHSVPDDGGGQLCVLLVTPRFFPDVGGVERHVHEVARRLVTRGCDVTVLCTDRSGSMDAHIVVDGIRVRRVRAWPARRDLYAAPGIWAAMAERDWDVVHVQSFHTLVAPLAMLRARNRQIPFVLTFHGGGHSSRLRRRLRRVQQLALGPLIRRAARLVAVARFEVPLYATTFSVPAERFVVIPNGTDVLPAADDIAPPSHVAPVIASIGRLERYKGHDRALDAFPAVLRRQPGSTLWIVGTGPDDDRLRRRAADLGVADHVRFCSTRAGRPDEMFELMRQTSLIVCLSDFETHPLVALEAVAVGRPLLVTATSGLQELAEDGLARSIPLSSSIDEVAEAIMAALDDPLIAHDVNLPTWDDCARALRQLYVGVAACES